MTSANLGALTGRVKKTSPRLLAYLFYIAGVLVSAVAAFVVASTQAR